MIEYSYATLPNGEKIHYRNENTHSQKQQAILLIHGNRSSLKWWDDAVEGLKDLGNRIIAVDLRGFGKSSYNSQCHRLNDWASDMVELIKILKLQKVILNGWSFGGAVALKVAQLIPQNITKLILTCAVGYQGHFVKNAQGQILRTQQQLLTDPTISYILGLINQKNEQKMREAFDSVLYIKMPNYPEERKKLLARDPLDQRCYVHVMESLANSDIDIEKIKVETLAIHGSEDNVLLAPTIYATAEKLGKLQLWEGMGHMIPVEDPPRYNNAIRNFIKGE